MKYQTSPYLSLKTMKTGFMAIYNVITDRDVKITDDTLNILRYCQFARDLHELINRFDINVIQNAINEKLIVDSLNIWSLSSIRLLELEINTNCNYRCQFCPVRTKPQDKHIMDLHTYEKILQRAACHSTIQAISFNFYNEPTLDPYFIERIQLLKKYDLLLILNTNASGLNLNIIQGLINANIVKEININLPSINSKEYENLTGTCLFAQSVENIITCIQYGLPIRIIINNYDLNQYKDIEKYFSSMGSSVEVIYNLTHDRAGYVADPIYPRVYVKRLYGCAQILTEMVVKYNGDVILCCMDYLGEYHLGNLYYQTINEIITGIPYMQIKKQIFGLTDARRLLCHRCMVMASTKIKKSQWMHILQ